MNFLDALRILPLSVSSRSQMTSNHYFLWACHCWNIIFYGHRTSPHIIRYSHNKVSLQAQKQQSQKKLKYLWGDEKARRTQQTHTVNIRTHTENGAKI